MSRAFAGLAILVAILIGTSGCKDEPAAKPQQAPPRPTLSLKRAVQVGDVAQVRAHLHHGTDVNARPEDGRVILSIAARGARPEHTEILRMLIAGGADVNANSTGAAKLVGVVRGGVAGYTPLHEAAEAGKLEHVRMLLDAGARVDVKTAAGDTPLRLATTMGHHKVVTLLKQHGAD